MQTLNQKFANLIHRHPWALQTALAVFIAVMAVGYTAHQQTNAQIAPSPTARIIYPELNEQLLLDSQYEINFAAPADSLVGFRVRKGLITKNIGMVNTGQPDSPIHKYNWAITEGDSMPGLGSTFLTDGPNAVTLTMEVDGALVSSRSINIWKASNTPVLPPNEPAPITAYDWAKPVGWGAQVFGADQKLLTLKWVGGADFPDNTSSNTFYTEPFDGLLGYYNTSGTLKPVGGFPSAWFSEMLLNKKEYLWTVPSDFDATQGLKLIMSSYSNKRGRPLSGSTFSSAVKMKSGTFMHWVAPKADGTSEPVQPKASYQLKWQISNDAYPPSGLWADIVLSYTKSDGSPGEKNILFDGYKYSPPNPMSNPYDGSRPFTIPFDAKLGSQLTFKISTYLDKRAVVPRRLFSETSATLQVVDPVPPATPGVIQVLKPSAGETLTNGELYTNKIQWQFTELPNPSGTTGGTIKYFLVPASDNSTNTSTPTGTLVGTDTLSSIKLNTIYAYSYWTINVPEAQLPGKFKIKVQYIPNDPEVAPLTEGIGGEFTISAVPPQAGAIEVFQPALNEPITSNGQRYDKIQWRFTTLPPLTGAKGGVIHYELIKAATSKTPATNTEIGTDSSLVGKDPVLGASYAYSSWVVSPVETAGQYAIRVRYVPSNGTPDVADSSDEFTINPAQPRPISATYYSAPIDVTSDGDLRFIKPNSLAVIHDHPAGTTAKFSVGFFVKNADGTYTQQGVGSISPDGYYFADVDTNGGEVFPGYFTTYNWITQVTHIKIKIEMGTPDFYNLALQPSVTSVTLSYDAERTAGQIGYVEFVVDPDTNQTKIEPGTSVDIAFTVTPMNDFAGEVMLSVSAVTNNESGQPATSISGLFVPATMTLPTQTSGIIRFTAAPNVSLDEGLYNFTIGGFKVGQPDLVLASATDHLFVGEVVPTESFTISAIGDITVAPGGQAQYTITATRIASYTGTITLTTNATTIFGDKIESPVFDPTGITFDSSDTNPEKTATLTIDTASGAADFASNFRITGTDTSIPPIVVSTNEPKLIISSDVTTLNVTIPLETGTYPTYTEYFSNLAAHPIFSLRVYTDGEEGAAGTMIATTTGFHTNTSNQATVVISELPTGTYRVFARTTRHLWKHATDKLVVTPDQTTYALEWDAAGLPAGDFDKNNTINVLDWGYILPTLGETGVGLLTNLDNDEGITIFDINYIIGMFNGAIAKFSMIGDWLPDIVPPAGN